MENTKRGQFAIDKIGSTMKKGFFSSTLVSMMREKVSGLWYKAGAKYTYSPTGKLKMSQSPILRRVGSIAEANGVKIVAGSALFALTGYAALELLTPEQAFGDTVDGNELAGTVTSMEDATTESASGPFAADADAVRSDDFVDYSNIDYHKNQETGEEVPHYGDSMQRFKEDFTEPETTPDTEPDTTPKTEPDTTPKTEPDTTPKTEPDTTPKTTPETEPVTTPRTTPVVTEVPRTADNIDSLTMAGALGAITAAGFTAFAGLKRKLGFGTNVVKNSGVNLAIVDGKIAYEDTKSNGIRK